MSILIKLIFKRGENQIASPGRSIWEVVTAKNQLVFEYAGEDNDRHLVFRGDIFLGIPRWIRFCCRVLYPARIWAFNALIIY